MRRDRLRVHTFRMVRANVGVELVDRVQVTVKQNDRDLTHFIVVRIATSRFGIHRSKHVVVQRDQVSVVHLRTPTIRLG
jgi:hypothetical protein